MASASMTQQPPTSIPWWLVLLEGIAAILTGLLLLFVPGRMVFILVQFLGIYWMVGGIFQIIAIFMDRSMWGWKLFAGILGIIAGLLIIQHPLYSALLVPTTVVIILGITGIFIGIINLIQALRGGGWGIGILGVLSIIFGLILLFNPVIGALALPWVLGIFGVLGGILALIGAFRMRSEATSVQPVVEMPTRSDTAAIEGVASKQPAPPTEESTPPVVEEPGEKAVEQIEERVEEIPVQGEIEEVDIPHPTEPEQMEKFQYDLAYIEGIGPTYAEQLKALGIHNVLDLLRRGATRKGREQIAEQSGISGKLILKWVNHVDLYRIKGIGSEYADLLEASGVDTVVELATRNSQNLLNKIVAVNEEKNLVRKVPVLSQVEDWVEQAKQLPRVITY